MGVSQFVVHRDAIRSTPKAVWEELLRLVLSATFSEWRKDRHVFELIWQHAFGVGADMLQTEWYVNEPTLLQRDSYEDLTTDDAGGVVNHRQVRVETGRERGDSTATRVQ
jgi:hypothetical protein